jgi:hypothetical protein
LRADLMALGTDFVFSTGMAISLVIIIIHPISETSRNHVGQRRNLSVVVHRDSKSFVR